MAAFYFQDSQSLMIDHEIGRCPQEAVSKQTLIAPQKNRLPFLGRRFLI